MARDVRGDRSGEVVRGRRRWRRRRSFVLGGSKRNEALTEAWGTHAHLVSVRMRLALHRLHYYLLLSSHHVSLHKLQIWDLFYFFQGGEGMRGDTPAWFWVDVKLQFIEEKRREGQGLVTKK